MHLLLAGTNHRTAALAEREILALADDEALRVIAGLKASAGVREAAVISTCNRTEFYVATADLAAGRQAMRSVVQDVKGLDLVAAGPMVYERSDSDAIDHLFRVAAGLDSMVVGEPQILSQVKDAHARARKARGTGPWLDRLFESALRAGKRARSETAIGVGVVSVASAACELARRHMTRLDGRSVLVIGVGETCRLAATHLMHHSPAALTIANRTYERAQALADHIGANAIGLDGLAAALATADLVLTATSAPHAIVTAPVMRAAMAGRPDRAMVVVDLAVPRDIEPEVAHIPGILLHTIDDIQQVVERSLAKRAGEVPLVEDLVADEVARFESWGRARLARTSAGAAAPQAGHAV